MSSIDLERMIFSNSDFFPVLCHLQACLQINYQPEFFFIPGDVFLKIKESSAKLFPVLEFI